MNFHPSYVEIAAMREQSTSSTKPSARERAAALFVEDFWSRISLPAVPLNHLTIAQLEWLDDDLADLERLAERLANNKGAGFVDHDAGSGEPSYETPLGAVMSSISQWASTQRRMTVSAAEALQPEHHGERCERLVFLMKDAAGLTTVDERFFELVEEYRAELASAPRR